MKAKILVVDDEQEFAVALSERLALRDFEVTTCLSGAEALERVKAHPCDVVLMDVAMPGMDGLETLKEIRKRKPLIEVILLSGRATIETAIQGLELGAMDYIKKPCETDELLRKIDEAYRVKYEHEEKIRKARIQNNLCTPAPPQAP
jgi:DNA-binding response OmpR family regulator